MRSKFKPSQRVTIKKSHTGCKSGKVISIEEIRYIVKQDDGLAFKINESDLEGE